MKLSWQWRRQLQVSTFSLFLSLSHIHTHTKHTHTPSLSLSRRLRLAALLCFSPSLTSAPIGPCDLPLLFPASLFLFPLFRLLLTTPPSSDVQCASVSHLSKRRAPCLVPVSIRPSLHLCFLSFVQLSVSRPLFLLSLTFSLSIKCSV